MRLERRLSSLRCLEFLRCLGSVLCLEFLRCLGSVWCLGSVLRLGFSPFRACRRVWV